MWAVTSYTVVTVQNTQSEHLRTFLEYPPKVEMMLAHIKFEPWIVLPIWKQFEETPQKKLDPSGHP